MPILAQISGSFTLTTDPRPPVPVRVVVEDPDAFYIDLTITERAAIAHAQRSSALGVGLEYEFESGVWVPFPDAEIGRVFNVEETTDQFGDVLTFELMGEQWSPFIRDLLRQRTQIRATLVYGSPANEYRQIVFTGFVVDHSFTGTPPHVQVKCLDAAGLYARRLAKDWILPANSGRTRLDIWTELLGIGGIPFDPPDLGPDEGGEINKPYAIGDTPIVVWLRDFLRVIGVEVAFIAGKFVAWRYNPHQQPVMEITEADAIPPDEYRAPSTLEPNVLGAVSVTVAYTDTLAPGAPEVLTTVIEAPYAPISYVEKQHDGVLSPATWSAPERVQTIYELVTRITRLGNVEIRVEEEERTMYARRAPRFFTLNGDIDPVLGAVYIYPDGSTRAEPTETLRTTRRMLRTKTLDASGNVVGVREERRAPRIVTRSTSHVEGGVDVPIAGVTVPLTDDGQGFYGGLEYDELPLTTNPFTLQPSAPMEIDITEYILAEDGTLAEERKLELGIGRGAEMRRVDGAQGYGTENTKYFRLETELQQTYNFPPGYGLLDLEGKYTSWRLTSKRYRAIGEGEDQYEVREEITENGKLISKPRQTVTGSLPRPERVEQTSSVQEIRATVEDGYRIALANDEKIEYIEHNEFLQNQAEAAYFARFLAWQKSAITLNVSVPIEAQIHKLKPVLVNFPATDGAKKFLVTAVRRDAVAFAEALTLEHRSPWLA